MFDSVLNAPLLIINKFDLCFSSWTTITFPVDKYLFKVNNRNTRTGCKICSKLTIKIPKLGTYFTCFTFFIVNFEQLNANWGKDYFLTNKIVKRRYERSFCHNYKDDRYKMGENFHHTAKMLLHFCNENNIWIWIKYHSESLKKLYFIFNPFLRNVVKWSDTANAARFLKCVWPFYDIAK